MSGISQQFDHRCIRIAPRRPAKSRLAVEKPARGMERQKESNLSIRKKHRGSEVVSTGRDEPRMDIVPHLARQSAFASLCQSLYSFLRSARVVTDASHCWNISLSVHVHVEKSVLDDEPSGRVLGQISCCAGMSLISSPETLA